MIQTTFHYRRNYGAYLQCWALQRYLERYSIKALDYQPPASVLYPRYMSQNKKNFMPLVWHIIAYIKYLYINDDRNPLPEYSKLKTTKRFNWFSEINIKDDVLICGSDQIWNPEFIAGRENVYFMDFANPNSRLISYAASLGVRQWPKEFEEKVIPMLRRFKAISVREESAVQYLSSLGLKDVVCVCDPTILHNGNYYREQFQGGSIPNSGYAFVYKLRETIPLAVTSIMPETVITVDLKHKKSVVSVTQWLAYIDNACFVVTDSFHCAVFCLLFHKPFIVMPNQSTGKGMNERFTTLLGKVGLEYRTLSYNENEKKARAILDRPIDWAHVDEVLDAWRTYSGNWLKTALEK